jgi:hypothetical protein
LWHPPIPGEQFSLPSEPLAHSSLNTPGQGRIIGTVFAQTGDLKAPAGDGTRREIRWLGVPPGGRFNRPVSDSLVLLDLTRRRWYANVFARGDQSISLFVIIPNFKEAYIWPDR